MDKSKHCFVISPIGATDSPQRKRADMVLKHIFKSALEPLGYTVVRADEISQPGSITLQVLERVLESELVIADLTDHNPNVFYELAVRHATQKPVIHVIDSGQKIPFDVADLRTISIDIDLEGADRARQQIIAQTKEIEAGNLGETPVKLAGVLKHLVAGKSDEKVILKQILDGMTELRSDYRKDVPKLVALNEQISRRVSRVTHEIKRTHTEREENTVLPLPDKEILIRRHLEARLNDVGDSVVDLAARKVSSQNESYIQVSVTTKDRRWESIGFLPETPLEIIAERMFNYLMASDEK